jgi:hypothetical protein
MCDGHWDCDTCGASRAEHCREQAAARTVVGVGLPEPTDEVLFSFVLERAGEILQSGENDAVELLRRLIDDFDSGALAREWGLAEVDRREERTVAVESCALEGRWDRAGVGL